MLVVSLAVAQVSSWGVLYYAFTIFLDPMRQEIDHRGLRLLMSAGSRAATPLVLAWSRVTNLITFYLIWAGLGVAMAAVLYEPAF